MSVKELSRKPKWRGTTYCSPWCGYGCQREAYNEAMHNAEKLAGRLGPGWKPRVWENLGWYWSAVNEGLKVHPPVAEGCSYVAFLGEKDSPGGRWTGSGHTPRAALRDLLDNLERQHYDISAALQTIKGCIK